ncbi:MAG: leucyl/phenylalanyl-tRNA--protein transferase [Phycisphaeraceae bacterium]
MSKRRKELTPELVLRAYCVGAFPMATSRHGHVDWYSPDPRAVLPLAAGAFHVSRSLRRVVRQERFAMTHDRAFEAVVQGCAEPRADSDETWINDEIARVFVELHRQGWAHSIEAWSPATDDADRDNVAAPGWRLAGGLYGLAIGGAFFAESKFTRERDASKVCLVHLVEHLRRQGFTLLDVQLTNPHLEQFGVVEIPRDTYLRQLSAAVRACAHW